MSAVGTDHILHLRFDSANDVKNGLILTEPTVLFFVICFVNGLKSVVTILGEATPLEMSLYKIAEYINSVKHGISI